MNAVLLNGPTEFERVSMILQYIVETSGSQTNPGVRSSLHIFVYTHT